MPRMKVLLPPLHVAIAASLALMAGMFSLVGFIASFFNGRPTFEVGIFATLFGWGLLCGKRRVRNAMIAFSVILFFGSIIPAGIITGLQISGKEPWIPLDSPRDLISAAIIASVSLYVFLVLRSPRHREWFEESDISDEQRDEEHQSAKFIAFPVIVVSLVLATLAHVGRWWANETVRSAYPQVVRVIGYDQETGKELAELHGPTIPVHNINRKNPAKLPSFVVVSRTEMIGDHKFLSLSIEGVFNRPFEFTLTSSDEYEPATVKFDQGPPREIRVPMKRKK